MIPGAVVEVRTPQGDFTAVSGTTLRGAEVPPGGDTHSRIASITKTMTSAVIVLLAQEGKLQFGDPVSRYVPNVPNGQNITIAELLKMRSGLYGLSEASPAAALATGVVDWQRAVGVAIIPTSMPTLVPPVATDRAALWLLPMITAERPDLPLTRWVITVDPV